MRPTWVILGVIVVVGAVAYLKLMDGAPPDQSAGNPSAATGAAPALARNTGEAAGGAQPVALPPEVEAAESRAKELLRDVAAATERRDRPAYEQAVSKLRGEAWDAPSARIFAVKLGWKTLDEAGRHQGAQRMRQLDQARRLLSRGVYLDAAFTASGGATPERTKLVRAIQKANAQVMTFGKREGGGLEGITRPFTVPPGWVPVRIVSREGLRYGHNTLLFWNHAGDLNPRRLRAGEVLLLPEEELTVQVHLDRRLLGLFLGDWFVKEFRVGVGRPDKPTPAGTFQIGQKMENPDWWGPNGHVPPLDPKNELGSAWMPIFSDELPVSAGFGIHGTNSPQTVGTRCSNGCVRLLDAQASELFWWVRTGSAGGQATTVVIR